MQVSVETTTGLERRMTVEVPAQDIETEVRNRLRSIARTARLDGFRPGKVPMSVVEKRFAESVRQEVIRDRVGSSFNEAMSQEKLRLAGGPKIETLPEQPDQGLSYSATFEIYPEISLADVSSLEFEKPTAEIAPENVDKMMQNLRRQRQTWEPAQRPAQTGDQLQIEIQTRLEGDESAGGSKQQTSVVLGASVLPRDVEDKLSGMEVDSVAVIDHRLPDDFHDPERAGKSIQYTVKLLALYTPVMPPVDEEFARTLGVESGSIEQLRAEVQENMQHELQLAVHNKLKQQVMDGLLKLHPIDVPNALVNREAEALLKQERQRLQAQGKTAQEASTLQGEIFTTVARRRVALGLLISEIIKDNGIKADPVRVRDIIDNQASTYEDPEEVVKWYYDSPERLSQIESLALEDQVVDWVLERAQVSRTESNFDTLMNQDQPVTA